MIEWKLLTKYGKEFLYVLAGRVHNVMKEEFVKYIVIYKKLFILTVQYAQFLSL